IGAAGPGRGDGRLPAGRRPRDRHRIRRAAGPGARPPSAARLIRRPCVGARLAHGAVGGRRRGIMGGRHRRGRAMTRRSARSGSGIAACLAVITALLPLTTLLLPSWLLPASAAVLAITVLGALRRRFHAAGALVAQLLALVVITWWAFSPHVLIGGLLPSGAGWQLLDVL